MIIPPFLREILNHLTEGAYILDQSRTILFWNPAAEKITGFQAEEVVGKSCKDNILRHIDDKGRNLCEDGCPMLCILSGERFIEADVFLHHKKGYRLPVHVKGILFPSTLFPTLNHPTENVAIELFFPLWQEFFIPTEALIRLALNDPLTETLNRRGLESLFYSRLQEMLAFKKHIGLLFLDVDNFKQINDHYGHSMGDKVLFNTASTLKHTLRPFDLLCRWGGEEFVVVVFLDTLAHLPKIAERYRSLIASQFIEEGDLCITVTASIGATSVSPPESLESAIQRADHLMYQAKQRGKNQVVCDITEEG
ncbi:MAG: sensor domain-containing diguanylate cyclase [Brevinematales bacterium]|nr:sensor domain-containing diguanylate cyclase [Brevinematales bacterium]